MAAAGEETLDDADDFDVGDGYEDPYTLHEANFDVAEERRAKRAASLDEEDRDLAEMAREERKSKRRPPAAKPKVVPDEEEPPRRKDKRRAEQVNPPDDTD